MKCHKYYWQEFLTGVKLNLHFTVFQNWTCLHSNCGLFGGIYEPSVKLPKESNTDYLLNLY